MASNGLSGEDVQRILGDFKSECRRIGGKLMTPSNNNVICRIGLGETIIDMEFNEHVVDVYGIIAEIRHPPEYKGMVTNVEQVFEEKDHPEWEGGMSITSKEGFFVVDQEGRMDFGVGW